MIGDRLGKWQIFKELGRGGMGRVYLGQEELSGRQAAIKVLAAELSVEAGFLHRFQREIDTLSQLTHPNIVRFYESGFENGIYYYAMEYVEGDSLDEILRKEGRLPWNEVLDIALQVCPALRHVHDHGIIHRDLKPPNLIRTPSGQVKLMDFGIAKVFASAHLTATGGVVGTAEFLSPEQAAGKPVTKRSDLYSLGVVLYTLLTGRTPFEGTSFIDLLHKHRYAQFDAPQKIVPEIPYEINDVVCQLLEKDPAKRPPDCMVLGRQLESIRKKLSRKGSHTEPGLGTDATVAEHGALLSNDGGAEGPATLMSRLMRSELEQQNRPHPLMEFFNRAWVLILLLAVVIGILVWTFWPLSDEALYARGAELMASSRPADWIRGWEEYLEPLSRRTGHPYEEDLARFKQKVDDFNKGTNTGSDAERFYHQGERLRQEGRLNDAKRMWDNVVTAFGAVESEKHWVQKSREALTEMEKGATAKARWQAARQALKQAAEFDAAGQRAKAEQIWNALEALYRDDPWATELRAEIAKARGR
jgi:predicted Ser/Thr protein kinase